MPRWKWRDMSEKQKALIQDKFTVSSTNNKQNIGNELATKDEVTPFDTPVYIVYRNIRKRKVDADTSFTKWVTDGLVLAGILKDDSSEFIQEIRSKEEVGEQEKTIVEIYDDS